MDLLGNVLLSTRVLANSIGIFDFGGDWGFGLPHTAPDFACSLTILEGRCWFRAEGQDGTWLCAGDTAIIVKGCPHSIAMSPQSPVMPLIDLLTPYGAGRFGPTTRREEPVHIHFGDGEPRTRILSLAYILREPEQNPVLSELPSSFVLREETHAIFPWLTSISTYLAEQKGARLPGYVATASHLADLMFTSFLRARIASHASTGQGWLMGLSDPRIGRVMSRLHADPLARWSVDDMAREANMARSTFARRFTDLLAQSPMDYLLGLRLGAARDRLLRDRPPITLLAELAGYQSERAFRTAFVKRYGMAPRAYLARHGTEAD